MYQGNGKEHEEERTGKKKVPTNRMDLPASSGAKGMNEEREKQ